MHGEYYEMPGKACERYIFHVMEYAYFFEMPKIRTLSDSLAFLCEFSPRALFLKCPISMCSIILKCPFSELDSEMGKMGFQKIT